MTAAPLPDSNPHTSSPKRSHELGKKRVSQVIMHLLQEPLLLGVGFIFVFRVAFLRIFHGITQLLLSVFGLGLFLHLLSRKAIAITRHITFRHWNIK